MTADVHSVHPTGCARCAALPVYRACLEHTCPDCGSIVYAEKNAAGELTHVCPSYSRKLGAARAVGPCPCECTTGGFCGGCGHAGCGRR